MRLNKKEWIARNLARAFLSDTDQTERESLQERATAVLDSSPVWLTDVLESVGKMSNSQWLACGLDSLAQRILKLAVFEDLFDNDPSLEVRKIFLCASRMRPPAWAIDMPPLPRLTTDRELARWLDLPVDRLAWLTSGTQDWRERPFGGAGHYRYRLQPKSRGGLRLIEIPKADLKRAQQRILKNLLQLIPVHEAAHGFVQEHSVASHAEIHAGRDVVIHFDLQDFFPSIRASRIHALWKTLGYPDSICRSLTSLCTTRTASAVAERLQEANALDWMGKKRLAARHLPQGAPTSPALANLCAFSLDMRLDGLAEAFGANYTRYADDLVFSGPALLRRRMTSLHAWVALIAGEEGFALHPRKVRCMPQHLQQRITGVVVNKHANVPRKDFERLKAQLHQCTLHGVAQAPEDVAGFRNHLLGRINWVGQFNAARKAKLMRLFARIEWLGNEK